jgi:DNA-binding FadR family transcriptional regulator
MNATSRFHSEEVAGFIISLVESGTLAYGTRVPSLREINRQKRVSLSTAL